MKKLSLRIFGVIGIILFLPLFLMTYQKPQFIERSGQSFVEWKLQSATNQKIDSIKLPEPTKIESLLGAKTKELRATTEIKLEAVKAQLKADAPSILATQISKLNNLDCACRSKWEDIIRSSMETRAFSLASLKSKLIDFTHITYMEIVQKLTRDVRIFLGANTAIFIFLLLLSFVKPREMKHLFLPATLMFVSTIVCSYFYLFEQNWFFTILYGSYTGFAYLAYLALVFATLCDIALNRARITRAIVNVCSSVVSAALSPIC